MNAFTDFFGKITGSSGPASHKMEVPPLSAYPSKEDAESALRYGFGYGSGNEAFIEGTRARVLGKIDYVLDHIDYPKKGQKGHPVAVNREQFSPTTAIGSNPADIIATVDGETVRGLKSALLDLKAPENKEVREKLGLAFARAALAAEHNSIAAFGFDPSRTIMDVVIGKANIGGAYEKTKDGIYANLSDMDPSSILHESIHRGLQKLREKSPEAKELISNHLPGEESVVRYMMAVMGGDPEGKGGPVDKEQREAALWYFGEHDGDWQGTRRKALNRVMEIAAELRKEQHPGGPH